MKTKSLKKSFFIALLIGLIIPFSLSMYYLEFMYKAKLIEEYKTERVNELNRFSNTISSSVWFYEKKNIEFYIKQLLENTSFTSIVIQDLKTDTIFLNKELIKDNCIPPLLNLIEEKIVFNKDTIGLIEAKYSLCEYKKKLNDNTYVLFITIISQIAISFFLLTWQLNKRVIKPANALIKQSKINDSAKLFTNIAHQWRQPLSEVANYIVNARTKIIHNKDIKKDEIEVLLKKSDIVIQHLSQTIDSFRNFYKADSKIEKIELNDIIKDLSFLITQSLKYNCIELKLNINDKLFVSAYKNELIQALLNIVTNSIDIFKTSDNKDKVIKIEAYKRSDSISLSLEDNAGGINIYPVESIFNLNVSKKEEGTGLGLYLTKEILEKIGAKIKVENTELGAKFTITFKF